MNCNYEDLEPIIGAALKKANTANERIDALPLPMVFKGTLGTGGTISTLPTASSENEGFVYIVITDGTYAGQTAKAGDTFVSDGSAWVLVPSGDEPSVIDDSVTSTALTWSSDKINKLTSIKSFTYTGTGEATNTINFPETPKFICGIFGQPDSTRIDSMNPCIWGAPRTSVISLYTNVNVNVPERSMLTTYSGNSITLQGENGYYALNVTNVDYTVYYI